MYRHLLVASLLAATSTAHGGELNFSSLQPKQSLEQRLKRTEKLDGTVLALGRLCGEPPNEFRCPESAPGSPVVSKCCRTPSPTHPGYVYFCALDCPPL